MPPFFPSLSFDSAGDQTLKKYLANKAGHHCLIVFKLSTITEMKDIGLQLNLMIKSMSLVCCLLDYLTLLVCFVPRS